MKSIILDLLLKLYRKCILPNCGRVFLMQIVCRRSQHLMHVVYLQNVQLYTMMMCATYNTDIVLDICQYENVRQNIK